MSSVRTSITNDSAWEQLFDQHQIVDRVNRDGMFKIDADQIRASGREPRLMAKFDTSSVLPQVFKANQFAILPVSRGDYTIGPFDAYQKLDYLPKTPIVVAAPKWETLGEMSSSSEASALAVAYHAGIIHRALGVDLATELATTIQGRMSSGEFSYHISTHGGSPIPITVSNAQIEIDGGFESEAAFCVCEAKNKLLDDMLVRQLYYPVRRWQGLHKPVVPLFFVYTGDVFHTFRYSVTDPNCYNSLKLDSHDVFTIGDLQLARSDIISLWNSTQRVPEPKAVFPQANSVERVIDLCNMLAEVRPTRDEVALAFEFDPRQTDYYVSAGLYLGLVERDTSGTQTSYRLTSEGSSFVRLSPYQRRRALIGCILARPVFHAVFGRVLSDWIAPTVDEVAQVMDVQHVDLGEGTIRRRASTVRRWIQWILDCALECV